MSLIGFPVKEVKTPSTTVQCVAKQIRVVPLPIWKVVTVKDAPIRRHASQKAHSSDRGDWDLAMHHISITVAG